MTTQEGEETFWGWTDAVLFIGCFLPAFVLASFVAGFARAITGETLSKAANAMIAQFAWWGLAFLGLRVIFKFRHQKPFWSSLGFGPLGWKPALAAIVMGPILWFGVAFVVTHIGPVEGKNPFHEMLDTWRAAVIIGFFATTLGPLCEEITFRGFFQPLLSRSLGPVFGMILSAAQFAIVHGPQYGWSWRHLLLLLLVGLAFAWQRFRTGSTLASTLTHAGYNAFMFIAYLATEGDMLGKW